MKVDIKVPKEVAVHSHPRSGTHYIASLLASNLYGRDDQRRTLGKRTHETPGEWMDASLELKHSTLFVYVFRNQLDVLRSLWNLRKQFNLHAKDFETFMNTPYKDLWKEEWMEDKELTVLTVESYTELKPITFTYFHPEYKNRTSMTPKEYHSYHIDAWRKAAEKDDRILLVNYETIVNDEYTRNKFIDSVARFTDRTVKTYKNIEHKVGWYADPKSIN